MMKRSSTEIPSGLRARLESARLDLLALFRALDQMDLSAEDIPQRHLRQLFALDADFAEALWGLDQPRRQLNIKAMLRDTLASLNRMPAAIAQFRNGLAPRAHPLLVNLEAMIRKTLDLREAYNQIPGRDPNS
jgi:hypothetical protein